MPLRPYVLSETSWKTVDQTRYDVAVLPWGATEAHNYHLPYGTDTIQTERIAIEAAAQAWSSHARVIVLPTVPFGVQTGQLDIKLCLNMNPSTQAALLADLAASLDGQGIHKLVLLNGHGGNDFRQIVRELQPRTRVFLSVVNWYKIVDPAGYFDDLGDHAAELETSVMMHLAPELVLPLDTAGPGRQRRSMLAAIRDGWAWAPRRWTSVTADTGIGDPSRSTAAKGARYSEVVVGRLAEYFVELAKIDAASLYE